MLPTPSTRHVPLNVYPAAEDSHILLDLFSSRSEQKFLHARFQDQLVPPLLVEVGIGSGVVLAFLMVNSECVFNRDDIFALGTDVNFTACKASKETMRLHFLERRQSIGSKNAELLDCTCTDLSGAIRDNEIDVLVFNPPYVPSDSVPSDWASQNESQGVDESLGLALAIDGGVQGMQVTQRFLNGLPRALNRRGVAYVLLCRRNKPEQVAQSVRGWDGGGVWTAEIVRNSGRTGGLENLSVLRIARQVE